MKKILSLAIMSLSFSSFSNVHITDLEKAEIVLKTLAEKTFKGSGDCPQINVNEEKYAELECFSNIGSIKVPKGREIRSLKNFVKFDRTSSTYTVTIKTGISSKVDSGKKKFVESRLGDKTFEQVYVDGVTDLDDLKNILSTRLGMEVTDVKFNTQGNK